MSCHTLLNNKLEKLIITFDNSRFGSLTGCTYQKEILYNSYLRMRTHLQPCLEL